MWCKFSKMTLEQRREKKLKMYNFFEESLEERLAGIKAARSKLEEQINRDTGTTTPTGTTPLDE